MQYLFLQYYNSLQFFLLIIQWYKSHKENYCDQIIIIIIIIIIIVL